MSSWRNAVKSKIHKERSQPLARQSLGLLEKKKDYKIRADHSHKKKNLIKRLQLKAALKNPDEFHTHMISLARDTKDVKKEAEDRILEKVKDSRILEGKRVEKERKVERLVASLQFMDNEEQNNHTIFVDNEESIRSWKPEEHFQTVPELVNRRYNRLSGEQLENAEITSQWEDEKQLEKLKKRREQRYKDLGEALDDQETIDRVMSHIQLRKNMSGKGRRVKVAEGDKGFADVYKWRFERKK